MEKTNVGNRNKPYETVQNRRKVLDFGQFAVLISTVFYDFIRFCMILYGFLHLLFPLKKFVMYAKNL